MALFDLSDEDLMKRLQSMTKAELMDNLAYFLGYAEQSRKELRLVLRKVVSCKKKGIQGEFS